MKYAILGGGCCFAQHFVQELMRDQKNYVFGIGRSPWQTTFVPPWTHFDYEQIDFADHRGILCLLDALDDWQPDVIVNFAARAESSTSMEEFAPLYFQFNTVQMIELVQALAVPERNYFQRFIQVSTGEVYGSCDSGPARTTDYLNPTTPYASSKAAFDQYLLALARRGSFPMNIVRPSNTYGEGQQMRRIIPKSFLFALTGQRLPLYGNGLGEKSYLHAADLASAIRLIAEKAPLSRVYNVAPRMYTSTRALVCKIAKMMDVPESQMFEDTGRRRGSDKRYWLDASDLERDTGWKQEISLEVGLARMRNWVRENLDDLKTQSHDYRVAA